MHRLLAASSPLEALEVGVAARSGVDDGAAADRRLAAEDDAVAARCDDGRREPELREALPCPHDASRHGRSAVVDMKTRPVCDRHELLECDVEPVARRERPAREQRIAPPQLVPLHAREARPRPADRARPARPGGRAPGRCARGRRVRRAPRGARRRRRSIPTRGSRSRPSRSRAARTRDRRRGAPAVVHIVFL